MDDKEIIKEALREWLDEKYAQFGRWSLKFFAALLFSYLIYFAFTNGIIKP